MFKKIITLGILLLTLQTAHAAHQIHYTKNLKKEMQTLQSLPEAKELIQKALRKGDIRIIAEYSPKEDSQAFWDGGNRRVVINMPRQTSFGDTLYSILFELHNAASDDVLKGIVDSARAGQLNKEEYVTKIEQMEHQNTVLCYNLYQKGIDRGLYPEEGQLPMVLTEFHDHFLMQQVLGHSSWVARTYDWNCPHKSHIAFRGTVPQNLSQKEINDILVYLSIKGDLSKPEMQNMAKKALEREIGDLQQEIARRGKQGQLKRKADLLQKIFNRTV